MNPEQRGIILAVVNLFRQISGCSGLRCSEVFMISSGGAPPYRAAHFALAVLAFPLTASIRLFSQLESR